MHKKPVPSTWKRLTMPSAGKYATGLIAGKHETAVKCREVRWQQV